MLQLLGAVTLSIAQPAAAPPEPLGPELAALRAFAGAHGERIWPGFGTAPFGMLLLRERQEVLLCHPTMPAGFTADGRDAATGCIRAVRPRGRFGAGMLAAMPLFGPPSTIVMGTPESTGLTLPRWRSTVFHEHFHQWQAALPDHYRHVAALDLAGGDQAGMWMLNFAFPYTDAAPAAAFAEASRAMVAALAARGTPAFRGRLAAYLDRRRAFAAAAGERNWRYFDFQLWQEGIARWTELALGRASADPAMRSDADLREAEIIAELGRPDLPGAGRGVVYALGAAEGLLMEACRAPWRTRYPQVLALTPLLDEAARACRPA
jgi:hypothetical protein